MTSKSNSGRREMRHSCVASATTIRYSKVRFFDMRIQHKGRLQKLAETSRCFCSRITALLVRLTSYVWHGGDPSLHWCWQTP